MKKVLKNHHFYTPIKKYIALHLNEMHSNLKSLTSIASVFRSFMKLLQKSCSIRPTDLMVRHKFRCRSDKNAKKSGGKEVTIPNREKGMLLIP